MSNLTDLIGGADLSNGFQFSYTLDRFNGLNSALFLNNGYLEVSQDIYFNGNSSSFLMFN